MNDYHENAEFGVDDPNEAIKGLRIEPYGGWEKCIDKLRTGQGVQMVFEPGDATRYTFVCVKYNDAIVWIIRTRGYASSDAYGAIVVDIDTDASYHQMLPIAASNEHTGLVCVAWINEMLRRLRG